MSLSKVVKEMNQIRRLFGNQRLLNMRALTMHDGLQIFRQIDSYLSPEWLTMDGERSFQQTKTREKMLRSAVAELVKRGFSKPKNLHNI